MEKTTPYEYWILRVRTPKCEPRRWYCPEYVTCQTLRRREAHTFGTPGEAKDARLLKHGAGYTILVHVTVLPSGSRAVVEAAKKLEATWGVKSPRGEARRAFRALQSAVRALEGK